MTAARKQGDAMLRYGQFCPVAKAAEIFADRWTPLIVRELCFGPKTFGDLLFAMPLISRTMLAQRLKEMAEAEVIGIEPKSQGRGHLYRLTAAGEDFRALIEQMSAWGQRWNQAIAPDELDPKLLMFGARRQIDLATLPAGRTVIRFEFRGVPKPKSKERYWWLVIQRPEPEICLKNPGFEVDAVVSADLAAFTRLSLGYLGLEEALGRQPRRIRRQRSGDRAAVPAASVAAETSAEDLPVRAQRRPLACRMDEFSRILRVTAAEAATTGGDGSAPGAKSVASIA